MPSRHMMQSFSKFETTAQNPTKEVSAKLLRSRAIVATHSSEHPGLAFPVSAQKNMM